MSKTELFNFDAVDYETACDTPFEFELKHPETGDGMNVFLSVVGTESATFKNYVRREGDKARRRNLERELKNEKPDILPMKEEEEMTAAALAACVTAWRTGDEPVIVWGDRRLECNHANATEWLTRFAFARSQVNAEASKIANFTAR